jgi:hypothetical protein
LWRDSKTLVSGFIRVYLLVQIFLLLSYKSGEPLELTHTKEWLARPLFLRDAALPKTDHL